MNSRVKSRGTTIVRVVCNNVSKLILKGWWLVWKMTQISCLRVAWPKGIHLKDIRNVDNQSWWIINLWMIWTTISSSEILVYLDQLSSYTKCMRSMNMVMKRRTKTDTTHPGRMVETELLHQTTTSSAATSLQFQSSILDKQIAPSSRRSQVSASSALTVCMKWSLHQCRRIDRQWTWPWCRTIRIIARVCLQQLITTRTSTLAIAIAYQQRQQ